MSFPETVDEILDVSEDEGELSRLMSLTAAVCGISCRELAAGCAGFSSASTAVCLCSHLQLCFPAQVERHAKRRLLLEKRKRKYDRLRVS